MVNMRTFVNLPYNFDLNVFTLSLPLNYVSVHSVYIVIEVIKSSVHLHFLRTVHSIDDNLNG